MTEKLLRDVLELDGDDALGSAHAVPGRLPATARLMPPSQTTVILRVSDDGAARVLAGMLGPRDANGVHAGAEAVVDRAASSTGQALPGDVKARFESSLGADLSNVRVHTGDDSAAAAKAVGAKAYTVGNDIHFGAGHYAPGDPFGIHLLAHEVAHTVQQQGAAPTRQHKLEVSTPGDAAEVEADRAADAMVRGQAATIASAPASLGRQILRGKEDGGGGEGGVGGSLSFEYSNGEVKIAEFPVGPYVKGEVTFKPTAKVSASKEGGGEAKPAGGEGAKPDAGGKPKDPTGAPDEKKEVEDGVKKQIDAAPAKIGGKPVEAEAGGGIKYDKHKKSVTLGGSFSLSSDFGPAKVELAPLEVSIASWDPKGGLSGPKIGASAQVTFPVWKTNIHGWKVEVTVAGGVGVEFTPNWVDIAAWVMSDVGAAALADIALVCVPAASAAAVFAGLYFAQQEGEDIGQISAAATKALQAYCQSYANVITGGAPAGGDGSAEGAAKATADLATLKANYPEPIVQQKAQEAGIYSKVVEAARPAFRARAEEEFKKKHAIRTALFGVPSDFYDNLDTRLGHVGNQSEEKSVGTRNDDGSI